MVSGRYFFPNAPLLCLNWMPARAVTSTNSIGPDGLGFAASAGGRFSAGGLTIGTSTGCGLDETFSWGVAVSPPAGLRSQPRAAIENSARNILYRRNRDRGNS